MPNQRAIPFHQFRGGSSKGIFFHKSDLAQDDDIRAGVLKWIMGAYGDARQVDGLGGADPLTSKIALVEVSTREDSDIDYTFIQAIVGEDRLDDTPNCGNLLSAVGAFGLETGLIKAEGAMAEVNVYMTNSGNRCRLEFPIKDGLPDYDGDAKIDGVLGTSAPVMCFYQDLAGSACGALLPTGAVTNDYDGVTVTCVDNGMPVVVLRADDFGMNGVETPNELNANEDLKTRIESIRLQAGRDMGLDDVRAKAVPKMCLVSPAQHAGNFSTRTFIPKTCHKAIGVLGAVSAATAAALDGSAINDLASVPVGAQKIMTIEHPSGVFDVRLDYDGDTITGAGLLRTARLLARGEAFIPRDVWPEETK